MAFAKKSWELLASAWFEGWQKRGKRLKHGSRIIEMSSLKETLKVFGSHSLLSLSMILSLASQQGIVHLWRTTAQWGSLLHLHSYVLPFTTWNQSPFSFFPVDFILPLGNVWRNSVTLPGTCKCSITAHYNYYFWTQITQPGSLRTACAIVSQLTP